jgi:hypothetical protein
VAEHFVEVLGGWLLSVEGRHHGVTVHAEIAAETAEPVRTEERLVELVLSQQASGS